MAKLPAIIFYPGDWLRDQIAGCSLAAQGLWLRMMILMHDSERYGYLSLNGSPIPPESIARRCGCTPDQYEILLAELTVAGVPSRTSEGVIYSRRMVRDFGKRENAKKNGKKGGNPTLKGGVKGGVNPRVNPAPEDEDEDEKRDGNRAEGGAGGAGKGKGKRAPYRQFTDFFCDRWQERHGSKYPFKAGKDGAAAASVWDGVGHDLAKARAVVERFLAETSEFYRGHPLAKLAMDLPRFLADAKPKAPGAPFGSDDPRHPDHQPPPLSPEAEAALADLEGGAV